MAFSKTSTEVKVADTGLNTSWDQWDSKIERFREEITAFVPSSGRQAYQPDTEDSFKPAQSVKFAKEIQGSFTEEIEKSQTGLHAEESGLRMETALLVRIGDAKKLEQAFTEWQGSSENKGYLALTKRFAHIDGKDLRGTLLAQAYMALALTDKMDEKAFPQGSKEKQEVLTREKNTVKFLTARAEKLTQSIQVRKKNIQDYQERIKKIREDYKRKSDEVSKKPFDVSIADTGLRRSSWAGNTAFGADGKQYGPQIPYSHAGHASTRVAALAFQSNQPTELARNLDTISTRLQKANTELVALNQKLEAEESKRAKLQAQLEKAQTRLEEKPGDAQARAEVLLANRELKSLVQSKTADGVAVKKEEVQTLSYSSPEAIEKEMASIQQRIPEYQKLLDQVGDPQNVERARQRAEERKTKSFPTDPSDRKAFTSLLWEAEAALDREKSRNVDKLPEEQKQAHTETLARLQMTVAFLKREATLLKRNIVTLKVNEKRLEERLEVVNRAYDLYEKNRRQSVPKLTVDTRETAQTASRREVPPLRLQAVGNSDGSEEVAQTQPKIENSLDRYQRALEKYGAAKSDYLTVLHDFDLEKQTPYNNPARAAQVVRAFKKAEENLSREYYRIPSNMRIKVQIIDTPESRKQQTDKDPIVVKALTKAAELINLKKNQKAIQQEFIDNLPKQLQVALTLWGIGLITVREYNEALKTQYEPVKKIFLNYAKGRANNRITINAGIQASYDEAQKLIRGLYARLSEQDSERVKRPKDLFKEVIENRDYQRAVQAKQKVQVR